MQLYSKYLRTQNLLIRTNLDKIASLGLAFYCFGTEAKTAVEQETILNGVSTLKTVLEKHFPEHIDMKPIPYENFYRPGWASSKEAEDSYKVNYFAKDLIFDNYKRL